MSKNSNLKMLAGLYEAFNKGDLEFVFSKIDENAEWTIIGDPDKIPISGRFVGHQQIMGTFRAVFETLEIGDNAPDKYISDGDEVAAYGTLTATVRSNGRKFESPFVDVFIMEKKKIVRFTRFLDSLQLYEAVHDK